MRRRSGRHGIALWDLRLTLRPRRAYATLRIRRHRDLVVDHGRAEELIDRVVVVAEAWTSESDHQTACHRGEMGVVTHCGECEQRAVVTQMRAAQSEDHECTGEQTVEQSATGSYRHPEE